MRLPRSLLPVVLLGIACGDSTSPPPPPTQLGFTIQPTEARQSTAFPTSVQVAVRLSGGATDTTATNAVTLALGTNSNAATLGGTKTVNAVAGIATFGGLSVDKHASTYTLVATSGSLTSATSAAFAVRLDTMFGKHVEFTESSSNVANFLLGGTVTVTEPVTITHLSVIGKGAGAQVKLALYTDAGGNPGTLVLATPATALVVGRLEIAVTATPLAAGTYWFVGNYSASASIGYTTANAAAVVKYISLPFASAPPTTFGTPSTYTGQEFNYYLRVLAP